MVLERDSGTIHTPNCAQVGFLTPVTCTLGGGTLYALVESGCEFEWLCKRRVCMHVRDLDIEPITRAIDLWL